MTKKETKEQPVTQEEPVTSESEVIEETEVIEEGPGKLFDFADVYFYCNKCGTDNKIADALRGISFTVPAAEKAEVKFECSNCGNMMKLHFVESSDEAKENRKKEIAEQEAAMAQTNEKDGVSQENTEVESGSASTDSTKRPTESNEEATGDTPSVDAVGQEVER